MITQRYPACILAACCVPWHEDGTLAEEIFRKMASVIRVKYPRWNSRK